MRLRKSLISGFAIPYNGFREVFFYAITVVITNPKIILRQCISLIGGFAIPFSSFREIFFYTVAVVITKSKVKLSQCISLFSSFLVILKSLIVFSVF